MHSVEHIIATLLRNSRAREAVIYFGPMGCRTGFYLLLAGDYSSRDIVPLMTQMCEFIRDFRGEVPGASPKDCGNYLDMNLPMTKYLADKYLREVLDQITQEDWFIPLTKCPACPFRKPSYRPKRAAAKSPLFAAAPLSSVLSSLSLNPRPLTPQRSGPRSLGMATVLYLQSSPAYPPGS